LHAKEAREQQDERRGGHAGSGHDREPGTKEIGRASQPGGHSREGRQRSAVDQAEQDEREADAADSGPVRRHAAHDGDADDVVEAARQRDPGDRRRAAGGGEREPVWALVRREEPLPAVRLEPVGEEEQHGGQAEPEQVRVRERPAGAPEMKDGERPHDGSDRDREDVEDQPGPPRACRTKNDLHRRSNRSRAEKARGLCDENDPFEGLLGPNRGSTQGPDNPTRRAGQSLR
jgi:hypothetical protein